MSFPNVKWFVANLLGAAIATVIFYGYHVAAGYTPPMLLYGVLFLLWFVVSFVDFYAYSDASMREENKTIGMQLRDMVFTFGVVVLVMFVFFGYHMYTNRTQRMQNLMVAGSNKLQQLVELMGRAGGNVKSGLRTIVIPATSNVLGETVMGGRS